MLHKMRIWDQRTANGVDHYLAISNYIARRVKKNYRREAEVLYPPVDMQHFTPGNIKEDYYIAASRFVPYKKMGLIIEAFANLPDKRLIVIGDGPDFTKTKARATANVELLGYQPTSELVSYLQRAKALIFAAEEDFGIIPLEAQAAGTPVIAYGKGGALETVRDLSTSHPTGVFFAEQTVAHIHQAIHTFEQHESLFTTENLVRNAARFATPVFREKFTSYILKKYQGLSCESDSRVPPLNLLSPMEN
jgi:glycosyltransferase involved in cell wall biosynthesis